jgi:hypothetical protein
MTKLRIAAGLLLLMLGSGLLIRNTSVLALQGAATETVTAIAGQHSGAIQPQTTQLSFSPSPTTPSAAEIATREQATQHTNLPTGPVSVSSAAVAGPAGGESNIKSETEVPGTFRIWRTSTLAPTSGNSDINERLAILVNMFGIPATGTPRVRSTAGQHGAMSTLPAR